MFPNLKPSDLRDYDGFYHASGFTRPVLAVTLAGKEEPVVVAEWGFLPPWAKDTSGVPQLNTRSEGMFESKMVQSSANKLRFGLLWIDGFYEPHHDHGQKQTSNYYIQMPNKEIFSLGIIYNDWTDKATGEITTTFSVLTCTPNFRMEWIHNRPADPGKYGPKDSRMPLIIPAESRDAWLNAGSIDEIKELVKPFADGVLVDHKVGIRVTAGKSNFNFPEVQDPAPEGPEQSSLF